jgi:hypothetical protein
VVLSKLPVTLKFNNGTLSLASPSPISSVVILRRRLGQWELGE